MRSKKIPALLLPTALDKVATSFFLEQREFILVLFHPPEILLHIVTTRTKKLVPKKSSSLIRLEKIDAFAIMVMIAVQAWNPQTLYNRHVH
jgi:hypothetical protein